MPNITISIDAELIEAGRKYAQTHQTSLNALIRSLLDREVRTDQIDWTEEWFALMDRAKGDSGGERWSREDLYES
jgi:hypothetical protein